MARLRGTGCGGKDVSGVERWLSRWAPLASVPAAALIVVAFASGSGSSPNSNAPVAQILATFLWALVAGIWLAVRAAPRVTADQPEPSLAAA